MPARGRLLTRSPLAPLASRSPFHALRVRSVVMAGHEAALEGGRRRRGRGLRGVGAGGRDKAFWKALFNTDLGNVVREGVRVRHREAKLTGFLDGGRRGKQGGLKLQMRLRAPPAPSPPPPLLSPSPLTRPSSPHPYLASHLVRAAPRFGPARVWPRASLEALARAPLSSSAVAWPFLLRRLCAPSSLNPSSKGLFSREDKRWEEQKEKKEEKKERTAAIFASRLLCRRLLLVGFISFSLSWRLTRLFFALGTIKSVVHGSWHV